MTTDIEMEELKPRVPKPSTSAQTEDGSGTDEAFDNSVAVWAWVSAALLTTLSLPLLFFPRFLHFLSEENDIEDRVLSPLEHLLSTHFGIFLIVIAITLVVYIPSSTPLEPQRKRDAIGHPLLGPLTLGSILSAFVAYNSKSVGSLSFLFTVSTATIGLWGLWVVLFEGSSRISRKTGADKHTSAFLFGNRQAASVKKKEWKRAQKD